ncbi:hypothetical protein O5466_12615 [Escherichia coli]|nr:hypothetical protein [Escherichia coli]
MTFDEKELDNAINKIIVTSLFSCLSDTQQKQFYESAFNMIERCCFCDADELPEKIRKQLTDALRVRLSDQFSEMYSRIWTNRKRPFPFRV